CTAINPVPGPDCVAGPAGGYTDGALPQTAFKAHLAQLLEVRASMAEGSAHGPLGWRVASEEEPADRPTDQYRVAATPESPPGAEPDHYAVIRPRVGVVERQRHGWAVNGVAVGEDLVVAAQQQRVRRGDSDHPERGRPAVVEQRPDRRPLPGDGAPGQ